MNRDRDSDLWWKSAVIYCLDVETFLDGDGDGVGDLRGLIERIHHLDRLGVNCLWLMPFYPSPNHDDGYDITDYYAVDPRLGSLGDFVVLVRAAKACGIKVIIDLVVNHTSDRHPWFRSSRSSPTSPFRDFYVWRDEPPPGPHPENVFPDAEDTVWTYDERAGQYYLHHFYAHQPDLNIANPAVRAEIEKVAGFWLQLGVDGFRIDAVPFLLETHGLPEGTDLDPHLLLKELRGYIARRQGASALLGEVNLPPDELVTYFGDEPGDQLQLLFDFPLNQYLWLAIARCDARPLRDALVARPPAPAESQWANFLRNHDELTLDKLTEAEREEVFAAFAPDDDMQLFGRGIRRRLPSMLGGDEARIRMAYSLMLSLPGTPVLFYGEEIGMGENLDIPGRQSVRTPMQWSPERNGGFSTARPSALRRKVPEGRFSPLAVNVADQRRDGGSLLAWMEHVIRRRRETPELSWGECEVLDLGPDHVFAHLCAGDDRDVIAVHNLGTVPCEVAVPVEPGCTIVDLLQGDAQPTAGEDHRLRITLGAYGYRWFAVQPSGRHRAP